MDNYKILSNLSVSENGFLFSPSTGESYTLNSIAIFIFNLLKSGTHSHDIIHHLCAEFEVDTVSAERDFTDLMTQLLNYNMVVKS